MLKTTTCKKKFVCPISEAKEARFSPSNKSNEFVKNIFELV